MKRVDIVDTLVDLIKSVSSQLPEDVLKAIRKASKQEVPSSPAASIFATILENCAIAAHKGVPICQDTGTLTFFINERLRRKVTPAKIKAAVAKATKLGLLRCNTIDSLTGASIDDNCAVDAPVIHYCEREGVTLILKGGGSENMSRQYSLPDAELGAGRDLEGVKKCVLDAVNKIQGYGCAPGILGVCIGADRATGYALAKEQLLRSLNDHAPDRRLAKLEKDLLASANSSGIGPMGLGGKTTLLGVKLTARTRLPASYFVTIAYMCWACRRKTILIG